MRTITSLCKILTLIAASWVVLPVAVTYACYIDCDCGLGGRCFFEPNESIGYCVNTTIITTNVYEDFYQLCVTIDPNRHVLRSDLAKLSDRDLMTQLVINSRESYKSLTLRNCACPYDISPFGGKCGKYSAYLRNERVSPVCYPSDVTQEQLDQFKSSGTVGSFEVN